MTRSMTNAVRTNVTKPAASPAITTYFCQISVATSIQMIAPTVMTAPKARTIRNIFSDMSTPEQLDAPESSDRRPAFPHGIPPAGSHVKTLSDHSPGGATRQHVRPTSHRRERKTPHRVVTADDEFTSTLSPSPSKRSGQHRPTAARTCPSLDHLQALHAPPQRRTRRVGRVFGGLTI